MDNNSALQRQFLRAIDDGDAALAIELVSEGASVNEAVHTADGETPLIRAILSSRAPMARALIELGADVNAPQLAGQGWTPLMFAREQPEIVRDLLAAGANVNARSAVVVGEKMHDGRISQFGGETALHLATAANNLEVIQLLLQAGADAEAKAANGQGPLDIALQAGRSGPAAEALVAAGAVLTPERIELMHSTAHSTDSDLAALLANPPPAVSQTESAVGAGRSLGELKCPGCGAQIFSWRTRLCEKCGAVLPVNTAEMNQKEQEHQKQRQWARELADAMGSGLEATRPPDGRPITGLPVPEGSRTVETLIRDHSQEFAHRKRPYFGLYLVGYGAMLLPIAWLSEAILPTRVPISSIFLILGFMGVSFFWAYRNASPICPNCKRNIRICSPDYCPYCGKTMRRGICADCGPVESLLGRWSARPGRGTIGYCPGCGTWLDTRITRQRFGV